MIKRMESILDSHVVVSDDGSLVEYNDHAAEMREVLEAGRMLYLYGDSVSRLAWLEIINKYAHYLEEK